MGRGPDTPVRDVMTADVKDCFEKQVIDEVPRNMADIQVRRLSALNRDKHLVGIIPRSDICVPSDGAAAYPANREHQNRTLLVSTTSSAAAGLPATRAFTYNHA
jgi:CBS-domain-containing membrane protein